LKPLEIGLGLVCRFSPLPAAPGYPLTSIPQLVSCPRKLMDDFMLMYPALVAR
jgi:hypothetical protein